MSQQILDQALELGKLIAESEEFSAVQEKEAAMLKDPAAQELLKEYQQLQQQYQQKQMRGEQITPEEIKAFEEKEVKMLENQFINEFHKAQNKFQNLLNTVNETINKAMLEKRGHQHGASCSTSG
ncbi:cell fate (sporulation/competence/biofilm development) regulator YlbF (YheA/YmcA/DUF963 family) [Desulfohalotomaculum tongense]|uniref:YlbF family regulator n=1 Tax=Desulforadius tongensis TaxID=1216062 RepID=UPI0019587C12|nr:YlbF family regulator [Desulforadius tongensis]MBM7854147.1 cell fate (sporulation/competence/biofilm development) regulator YlbF (YheA/YmcA/DUF963 family) [Desulforadius tongensis]